MHLKKITKDSDVPLKGIKTEIDLVDNVVKSIKLLDAEGNMLIAKLDGWSEFHLLILAPPPMKKVHRLSGTLMGIPMQEDYNDAYEAQSRKGGIAARVGDLTEVELNITEMEVPE